MKESLKKWNNAVLNLHNEILFSEVLDKHHIAGLRKMVSFKDIDGVKLPPMEGFYVIKGEQKYYLNPSTIEDMPIKMQEYEKVVDKDESLVYIPVDYKSFRIKPLNIFEGKEEDRYQWFDDFYGVEHSQPIQFKAFKCLMFACELGKLALCISTEKGFGKSQVAKLLSNILNESSVSPAGTYKGMLDKLSGSGCLWIDEAKDMTLEKRQARESLLLHLAGSSDKINNEALAVGKTKAEYGIRQQSICNLYNLIEYYKKMHTFFDFTIDNQDAVMDRVFQFRFEGMSEEVFDDRFDFGKVAEDNKMFYIQVAKYLKYLKELIRKDDYKERFSYEWSKVLTSRKKSQLRDIMWVVDVFSRDEEEYKSIMECLDKASSDYTLAVSRASDY